MRQKAVLVFLCLVCAVMVPVLVAAAGRPTELPPLLKGIEEKYTRAATLTAKFTQTNEVLVLKRKKTSSGRIFVKRPNRIRWETLQPDPNILVSDGKRVWYYTPPFDETEHGQVIEKKASTIQTRLANALLSGSFNMAKDMKIRVNGVIDVKGRFILTPKPGAAGTVEEAEVVVDAEKQLIEKLILSHKGGNRSEIVLSDIELGKDLGDSMFIFVAPPNTDRMGQ